MTFNLKTFLAGHLETAKSRSPIVFTVGGIAKVTAKSADGEKSASDVRLSIPLLNAGTGDFANGRVVITLQRINGNDRPIFQRRWEMPLPEIAAGGNATFKTSFSKDVFSQGDFYFYGHIHAEGMRDDPDKLQDFKSEPFSL